MLADGLFNVQGTKDKPGKPGKPNGYSRSTPLPNGEYTWLNWFAGSKKALEDGAKGLYFGLLTAFLKTPTNPLI